MYKVGDKVKILNTSYSKLEDLRKGCIATVHKVNSRSSVQLFTAYYENNNNGQGLCFYNSEVEPYQETQTTNMKEEIKVGDQVRLLTTSGFNRDFVKVGDIATVQRLPSGINDNYALGCSSWKYGQLANLRDFELITKHNMKEIVGYNIKKEFEAQVTTIAKALDTHPRMTSNKGVEVWMPSKCGVFDNAIKLGVLDLWFEPVYKSSELLVKLSKDRTATIKSKTSATITVCADHFTISNVEVANAVVGLNDLHNIAGFKVEVREFHLGCQQFTVKDLLAVNQAFKDFN